MHDKVEIGDLRVLLVESLSLPDLDDLTEIEDDLERVERQVSEERVVEPDLLQEQVLLAHLPCVH